MHTQIGILGTGSAAPQRILSNAELEQLVDTSDDWIVSRTGIRQRRIAGPEDSTAGLAHQAALRALEAAGSEPAKIDLIICATVTPDRPFPAVACVLQELLGLKSIPAFDLSAGCSGFGYAITVAEALLRGGGFRTALVVGVDLLSRITDYEDRATCVLFGDGAGAVLLGTVPQGYGILATELGAEGSGGQYLYLGENGYIEMAGRDVFKFAVRIMEESARRVVAAAGLRLEQVDWVIPHQANVRIINSAQARLGIPPERFYVNVERYGNTSAASVGLALDELARAGGLTSGDHLVLVGFGAGLTWSALLIRWWQGETDHGSP